MSTINIKGLEIGAGMPKICVPIAGRTRDDIRDRLGELLDAGADLAEWRADWYEDVAKKDMLLDALSYLRDGLGKTPLLVTFRTKEEGGERQISVEDYRGFLKDVIESGKADLLDVELGRGDKLLRDVCGEAHAAGVYVVASSHDFTGTPGEEEIVGRLGRMQALGADILKLAAMPRTPEDVLALSAATWKMASKEDAKPIITMSMGGLGAVSRVSGEIFGSAVTFGSAGVASAPGQISVDKLRSVLETLHEALI